MSNHITSKELFNNVSLQFGSIDKITEVYDESKLYCLWLDKFCNVKIKDNMPFVLHDLAYSALCHYTDICGRIQTLML